MIFYSGNQDGFGEGSSWSIDGYVDGITQCYTTGYVIKVMDLCGRLEYWADTTALVY